MPVTEQRHPGLVGSPERVDAAVRDQCRGFDNLGRRQPIRRPPLVVLTGCLASLVFSGCESGPSEVRGNSVRDSAGVRIVENAAPRSDSSSGWIVDPHPLVEFGGANETAGAELFRVRGMVRLSDGRTVVANGGTSELFFFDPNGRLGASVGGEGEGPGEFIRLEWIEHMRNDSIVAFDMEQRRISVFSPDGTLARDLRLEQSSEVSFANVFARTDSGALLARGGVEVGPETPSGLQRYEVEWFLFDSRGRFVTTLGSFRGSETFYDPIDGGFTVRNPLFGRDTYAGTLGEEIFVAFSDTYEIEFLDTTGRLRRVVRRKWEPRRLGDEDFRRERERRLSGLDADNVEARRDLLQGFARLPRPETVPPYSAVLADPHGFLWVREYSLPWEEARTWSVFDSEGQWVRDVVAPAGLDIHRIGDDYVLGRQDDPFGLFRVALHGLAR